MFRNSVLAELFAQRCLPVHTVATAHSGHVLRHRKTVKWARSRPSPNHPTLLRNKIDVGLTYPACVIRITSTNPSALNTAGPQPTRRGFAVPPNRTPAPAPALLPVPSTRDRDLCGVRARRVCRHIKPCLSGSGSPFLRSDQMKSLLLSWLPPTSRPLMPPATVAPTSDHPATTVDRSGRPCPQTRRA